MPSALRSSGVTPQHGSQRAKRNTHKVHQYAGNVLPVIRQIATRGASLRQIVDELNKCGAKTARGGLSCVDIVRNILASKGSDEVADA